MQPKNTGQKKGNELPDTRPLRRSILETRQCMHICGSLESYLANKRARWRPGHRGRGADSDPGTGHTGPNRVEGTHTRLHAGPWPQTLDFAPRLGPLMHLHAAPPRFHLHLANLRLGSWTPRAPMTPSVCTMCRAAVGRQLALVGRVAYFYLVLSDGGSAPFWGVPAELDKVFAFARHDRLVWFCRLGRSSTKRNSPAV